jgi:hypothetical protein
MRHNDYEGLYKLHRRVAELEEQQQAVSDPYDRQIEATLEAMREVVS